MQVPLEVVLKSQLGDKFLVRGLLGLFCMWIALRSAISPQVRQSPEQFAQDQQPATLIAATPSTSTE